MSRNADDVDGALQVLRAREWAAPEHRAQLKESLMNAHESHVIGSRRRRALLLAGAGLLALSGLGFVAAQQMGWTKVFLRTEVDGQIVEVELTPDENGQVYVMLETEDGPAEFAIPVPQCEEDDAWLIDATQQMEFIPAEAELQWVPADGAANAPR